MKLVAGHLTLKNGRYYAVLNYRNAGGQRKTKWISLGLPEKGSKRKAEAELARLRAEFEPPKEVGDLSSDMLFADYLLEWLEIAKGRLAVATYSSYAAMIKKPVGPYFRQRNLTLRELEARHLQMFYSEMLRKVKPNTVIHYHAIIHSALKYAMKTDMVPQNVAMKVDRPRKNSFQPTFLDAEQMQKLFEIVKGTRLELPVLVAAFYGLRRGEVLGLKWDAIDFNRGTLTIKRTVTEATIDGTMKIIEQDSAKTKSSLRTLPLVGSFRDYFQKVKEAQELNKKVCGNCYNYDYDGYVFVNELEERMRPDYLTEYFPKYIAKHGVPKMRFHDLRHSCASLLLANGVPLKQIQEWLGHSDFSTTANIYAHLDYRSKISSAQAMEQGMLLPRSDDFGCRWEDVTEQGKIAEPDLNPIFD
jgi:integrase